MSCRAFSLVELSIVLVIIGLLVGGVLVGQELIRASEIRSIGTDTHRYVAATMAFRDKYLYYPGDMPNATKFWGMESNIPCDLATSTTKATCDGDGDGIIGGIGGAYSYEQPRYWQHLANAGLIDGTYTGRGGYAAVGVPHGGYMAGINAPKMKIPLVTAAVRYYGSMPAGNSDLYPGEYGHMYFVGISTNYYATDPFTPFLTPTEALSLDTKMDDGKPAFGMIRSWLFGTANAWSSANANCANEANPNLADYATTRSTRDCSLIITWVK